MPMESEQEYVSVRGEQEAEQRGKGKDDYMTQMTEA